MDGHKGPLRRFGLLGLRILTVIPLYSIKTAGREMLSYAHLPLEQSNVMIPATCTSLEKVLYNGQDIDQELINM